MAQVDAFLALDGIQGESQDSVHANQIDVLSWSWSLTNSGSAHFAKGMGQGKVQVGDIHIVKRVDSATPILMQACTTGTHIANGTLTVRKAGGTSALEYFVIKLQNILISSIRTSSDPSSPVLMEDVSLNFGWFQVTYTPQEEQGSGGATVDFGYDIQQNKTA
jgi:type VI secretion system secreted protein Hcp